MIETQLKKNSSEKRNNESTRETTDSNTILQINNTIVEVRETTNSTRNRWLLVTKRPRYHLYRKVAEFQYTVEYFINNVLHMTTKILGGAKWVVVGYFQ